MKISKKGQLWCFWADQCRGQSGGQQLSCLGVATLGATVPPSPQCLLNNILWQKFVFFKCEPRYFPTLGSTQYTAIQCGMLRWENLVITSHWHCQIREGEGGQRQVLAGAPAYSITWGWLAANEMLMLELMRWGVLSGAPVRHTALLTGHLQFPRK